MLDARLGAACARRIYSLDKMKNEFLFSCTRKNVSLGTLFAFEQRVQCTVYTRAGSYCVCRSVCGGVS